VNNQPIIYLAPLKNSTEINFRNIFAKHFQGIDITIDPFVSLNAADSTDKVRKWNIPNVNKQLMNVIPQFLGRNLKDFYHFVKWIKYHGYTELNWNLGCPVSKIVKKGRGCGQLEKPDEIKAFLDDIFSNIDIGFSIKTRLGMHDPEECFKLIEIYNQYPLKELIIHPRIGKQLYSGDIQLDYFEELLRLSKNELVYNGDIKTKEDFKNISTRFPSVKKFMLGRGILKDPFLAERIKGIYTDDKSDMKRFIPFYQDLFKIFQEIFRDEDKLAGKMKEYWRSFAYMFEDRNAVAKYVLRSQSLKEFNDRVDNILLSF
jgi:tRNA-dihydrouridine synthase